MDPREALPPAHHVVDRGGRLVYTGRYAPTDGSSTRGGSTSVRGRVRSPHLARLQAASVPIAYGSCAPRAETDRRRDGRIAVSFHAPYGGSIINWGYWPTLSVKADCRNCQLSSTDDGCQFITPSIHLKFVSELRVRWAIDVLW